MSSDDRAVFSLLQFSSDSAVAVGIALACAAVRALLKYRSDSAALTKIRTAPSLQIGDLRSLLSKEQSESRDEPPLVFVRGTVGVKSIVEGGIGKSLRPNVLFSQESGDKAVIIQRMQTCFYNEWRGFFGWIHDYRAILGESMNKQETTSMRMVPFILVEGDRWLNVNLHGSKHPLPLTSVYHHLQPIYASPYTFLQAFLGFKYPVGMLDEEKILPFGKEISAVGICSLNDGVPEIKSCKELPYFLSEMTKDQMVLDLVVNTKALLWSGIILGSISIGLLGYAVVRNWRKWKEWRQPRVRAIEQVEADEETDNVPDNELCVVCLMRRRIFAFVPCGHLVCCDRCAIRIESASSAKCPVCCQYVQTSVRIFNS